MSPILLILSGSAAVTAVYLLVVGITRAPEGYEDETGFHVSAKSPIAKKRRIRLSPARLRASAGAVDLHLPAA